MYGATTSSPVVRTVTGCSPTGRPSLNVTKVNSASRRIFPSAMAYAAPPVVPFV